MQSLVIIVVIENSNYSYWGAPYVGKPKTKTNQLFFRSDFRNVN